MCRKTFFWGPCWNIPTMWRILFGGLRAEIVLTRNQGFLEFVQGHFWGPWSNIDFSEKRSPLAVTYSYQQFSDIRLLFKDEWSPGGQFISRTCHEIKCYIIEIEVAHWALHLKDQMKWNKVFPFSKVHSVKMTHCVNTYQGPSLEIKCQHINKLHLSVKETLFWNAVISVNSQLHTSD